jgi:beta-N-acetylhexosaminidase
MKDVVRRVGRRLMVGFEGATASADVKALIRDFAVGHVILFARNVEGPEQLADLVRELQETARAAGHDRPLVVAVDQEGGRVARLKSPWTKWPPLRALGQGAEESRARRMGEALAVELRACGITLDFAPVVDVDTNPDNPVIGDRSFGSDPDLVGRLGAALIRGLQANSVAACAKHFPGHGDTNVDSHLDLPVVEHPRSRLDEVELRPFRQAIDAGVATLMTAHILVPELDPEAPATLSPQILDGLLRHELGYEGVVVADDLEMKAVAKRWRPGESAVRAARAGCDILPVCRDHDAQVEAAEGLIRAVEAGTITFREMEASEGRLERLAALVLSGYTDPDPREARLAAGRDEHRALADEIARAAGIAV